MWVGVRVVECGIWDEVFISHTICCVLIGLFCVLGFYFLSDGRV